ncbi:MAG: serine/threonine protein kinase [Calditrichaeota bacterium]|nr:MAG: serine/threonine protein kinase [Calditrichota bacterium]
MLPTTLEAKYNLLDKLGVGGTAVVYKVQDKSTGKLYALKLKSDSVENTDIDFSMLAKREYELIHHLYYPGIVKIHEIDTNHSDYVLLDYCEGQVLDEVGKIENLTSALNIISSIAVNLEYIHTHKIIHADLKPENIFLPVDINICNTEKLFYTKFFDFSLGKNLNEDGTNRVGVGTIGYMAPEIIDTNNVTTKSDLFALGVIAYQVLTGEHPFINEDTDPVLINSKIKEEKPKNLTEFRPDLSDEIVSLVESLLSKNEAKRPKSAWEVCSRLAKCGASFPYKKAMHPKYFVQKENPDKTFDFLSSEENIQNEIQAKYDTFEKIRLFLSMNFTRNNIRYKDGSFVFVNHPYTPKKIIHQEISNYIILPQKEKKEILTSSIINDTELSERLNLSFSKNLILNEILPYLLHTQTIKRTARKYAPIIKEMANYRTAAELYVKAGDIKQAEDCAYQAAAELRNENKASEALRLLQKVIELAEFTSNLFMVRSLIKVKADIFKDIGETEKSEKTYTLLIKLFEDHKNDKLLAETYKNLGDLYKLKQSPKKGITALKRALEIYQELGDELEISHTYNNLGTNYWIDNDYENSTSYYRKALRIQRKLNAQKETASTLNNIAIIHTIKGRFSRAIKIFNICIKIQKEIGIKSELARTLNNVGYCYLVLSEYDKSVEYTLESLKYNQEIGAQKEVLINLENLTTMTFITNRLNDSIRYLKEGIRISTELGDELQIGIFKVFLTSVFIKMGRLREADAAFNEIDRIIEHQDDIYLKSIYFLEKTQLATQLNNHTQANEYIKTLYELTEILQDKTVLVKTKLLDSYFADSDEIIIENAKLIDELKLNRENYLNMHNHLHFCLHHSLDEKASQLVKKLEEKSELIKNDIECPAIFNTMSEYYLKNDDIEKALAYITISKKTAKSSNLVFEFLRSEITEGKIRKNKNELEACYALYRSALDTAKNIASQISDDSVRQLFQQKKEILFLIKEIKELSNLLSHKKEQVN